MIPRRDPETAPIGYRRQFLCRPSSTPYGEVKNRSDVSWRVFETRNGVPWKPYRYDGTGESMSAREAEWWLTETISEAKECPLCSD